MRAVRDDRPKIIKETYLQIMHLLRLLSSSPLAASLKNWSMLCKCSLSVNIVFPFSSGSDSLDVAGGIATCEVWSSTNQWVFRLLIISGLTLWHRFGCFWCNRNCRRGGAASSSSNTGMSKIMLAFWGCCRCRCRCRRGCDMSSRSASFNESVRRVDGSRVHLASGPSTFPGFAISMRLCLW